MIDNQIILFKPKEGETKIEFGLAGEPKLKAKEEYDKFRKRTSYHLSSVEIHFPETFEAEQKHLHSQEIAVAC